MTTTYVLDTNIFIDDFLILNRLGQCNIVIPFIVLEELDKHKTAKGMLGASARNVIREIDGLSEQGDLLKGVKNGAKAKVSVMPWTEVCKAALTTNQLEDTHDNRILATALSLIGGKKSIVLLSNDVSLRIKAKSIGVKSISHSSKETVDSVDEMFDGLKEFVCSGNLIDSCPKN